MLVLIEVLAAMDFEASDWAHDADQECHAACGCGTCGADTYAHQLGRMRDAHQIDFTVTTGPGYPVVEVFRVHGTSRLNSCYYCEDDVAVG